ncbi:MAG: hypothetical protein ACI9DF_003220 [Verrucomicrobiales bacterium]|jgi:hypothetical protein
MFRMMIRAVPQSYVKRSEDLKFILLADAYYANGKMIDGAKARSCDLVTRVRKSTVAFEKAPVPKKRKRGRPKTRTQ